jgi:hypothetical protein
VRLAQHGLVHFELNAFSLMVDLSGIQQSTISYQHVNYVRHSGLSVAAESNPGMLKCTGTIGTRSSEAIATDQVDVGSEKEALLPPIELLDDSESKPIVTLIDFPQVVSMQHPNVYTHKLQFQIPESEQENLSLTWDAALSLMNEQIRNQEQKATLSSNAESSLADTGSVILASKTRLALDQQLNASGFS